MDARDGDLITEAYERSITVRSTGKMRQLCLGSLYLLLPAGLLCQ